MTMGTIMMSGGIGKKELSTKETMAKNVFELLCAASFKDFLYKFLNIFWF